MASEKLVYYNVNILRDIQNWTLTNSELNSDNSVTIHSGGNISSSVTDTIYMVASKYRKLNIQFIDNGINDSYNYQNIVAFQQEVTYVNQNSENTEDTIITPILNYGNTIVENNTLQMTNTIPMLNQALSKCNVMLYNKSDHDITIKNIILLRSNDLTGQLSEEGGGGVDKPTKLGITCSRSDYTLDGCFDVIYFDPEIPSSYDKTYPPPSTGSYFWEIRRTETGSDANICIGKGIAKIETTQYIGGFNYLNENYTGRQYVSGIRNGDFIIKLYISIPVNIQPTPEYTKEDIEKWYEHNGEYYEQQFTVKNCNSGGINVIKLDIDGYNGTPFRFQMSPHRWITNKEGLTQYQPGLWISSNGNDFSDIYKRCTLNLKRDLSLDGGVFSFARHNNIDEQNNIIIEEFENTVTLYGVTNGQQRMLLEAPDDFGSDQVFLNETITIKNACEGFIIVADKNPVFTTKESLEEIVTFTLQSVPTGIPYMYVKRAENTEVSRLWTYPHSKTTFLTSEPGKDIQEGPELVNSAYIVLQPKETLTSQDNGEYDVGLLVSTQIDGVYEYIKKDFIIELPDIPLPQYKWSSSTNSFTIKRYNDTINLIPNPALDDNYIGSTQSSIDGGTIAFGTWNKYNQALPITAKNTGKVLIKLNKQGALDNYGDVTIIIDYTDWFNSINPIYPTDNPNIVYDAETETCIIKQPNQAVSLTMDNLNSNINIQGYISGYKYEVTKSFQYNYQTNILNMTTKYSDDYTVLLKAQDIGFEKYLKFKNDYTEYINNINIISSTGSFDIKLNDTITITLENYITGDSAYNPSILNGTSLEGGTIRLGSYNNSTSSFTVQGTHTGTVIIIINKAEMKLYKEVTINITE